MLFIGNRQEILRLNEISQEWRYKYLRISLLNGLQKVCGKYRLLKYIYTWLSQIFVPEWADCSSPILPETSWNILVCGIWKSWAPGSPGWAAGGWCWLWIATVRRSKFKVWRRNKTWSPVAQCLRFMKHPALPYGLFQIKLKLINPTAKQNITYKIWGDN